METMETTTRKPLHPLRECARLSGNAESTWRCWILQGRVDVVRMGKSLRIADHELDRVLREGPRPLADT